MTADRAATVDIEEILKDPSQAYASPMAVVNDTRLSTADRRRILEEWEVDAKELIVAAEEGMAGGEPAMLHRVQDALRNLDNRES